MNDVCEQLFALVSNTLKPLLPSQFFKQKPFFFQILTSVPQDHTSAVLLLCAITPMGLTAVALSQDIMGDGMNCTKLEDITIFFQIFHFTLSCTKSMILLLLLLSCIMRNYANSV